MFRSNAEKEQNGGTNKTKNPSPTIALLCPQAVPHKFAVLYAACAAKAESQKMVKTPSTAAMACGWASFLVRGNRGAMQR